MPKSFRWLSVTSNRVLITSVYSDWSFLSLKWNPCWDDDQMHLQMAGMSISSPCYSYKTHEYIMIFNESEPSKYVQFLVSFSKLNVKQKADRLFMQMNQKLFHQNCINRSKHCFWSAFFLWFTDILYSLKWTRCKSIIHVKIRQY